MRVAVVGVGAVGGYFGGRLAHGGENVVFVERGPTPRHAFLYASLLPQERKARGEIEFPAGTRTAAL